MGVWINLPFSVFVGVGDTHTSDRFADIASAGVAILGKLSFVNEK